MAKRAKKLRPGPEQMLKLVPSMGGCIASDRITVDGKSVGQMSRDPAEREYDSGWVFLAGDETQAYMDDPNNFGIYDVNTIANFDRTIIPFLYALPGQRFDRDSKTGGFIEAPDSEPNQSAAHLPSGIQVVQGKVQLSGRWTLALPSPFRRRREDESHVFWRPGLTIWIAELEKSAGPVSGRAESLRAEISAEASDIRRERKGGSERLSYRLAEKASDARVPALYAFVISPSAQLQVAAYFDREEELVAARQVVESVSHDGGLT